MGQTDLAPQLVHEIVRYLLSLTVWEDQIQAIMMPPKNHNHLQSDRRPELLRRNIH